MSWLPKISPGFLKSLFFLYTERGIIFRVFYTSLEETMGKDKLGRKKSGHPLHQCRFPGVVYSEESAETACFRDTGVGAGSINSSGDGGDSNKDGEIVSDDRWHERQAVQLIRAGC